MESSVGEGLGGGAVGARTALGRILGPRLLELLHKLRLEGHELARAVSAESSPLRDIKRLEAVEAAPEAPRHLNDLGVDHRCIGDQEEDQIAPCHAHDTTRSQQGSKGAQLRWGVSNELLLRDGSNSATNTKQVRLDELAAWPSVAC